MSTKPIPLRIPNELVELSKLRAQQEHVDQATALRQFLFLGAEEYVLTLVSEGRITIGKAAEMLKVSIYDIHQLTKKHGIEIGPTLEQMKKSRKFAQELFK